MAARVHELAAELEVEVSDLIGELEKIGVAVRNHMSRLKDADIQRLYAAYEQRKNARAMDWSKSRQTLEKAQREKELEEQQRKIEEALARAAAARAQAEAERKSAHAFVERKKADEIKKTGEEQRSEAATAATLSTDASAGAVETAAETPTAATAALSPTAPGRTRRVTRRIVPRLVPPPPPPKPSAKRGGRERNRERVGERGERVAERAGRGERPAERAERPAERGPERKAPVAREDMPLDLTAVLPTIEVMKLDKELPRRVRRKDRKKSKEVDVSETEDLIVPRKRAGGRRPLPGGAKPRSLVVKKPARRMTPMIPVVPAVKKITVHGDITVAQLADKLRVDGSEIIKRTLEMGTPLTLNETVDRDVVELIAMELGFEVDILPDTDESDVEKYAREHADVASYRPRPPVVTIMGHVDHGKTSLLEQIAKLEVLSTEYGGITQHIGAYHVKTERGDVVFLDTPGHAAFTAMRQRGAQATDIVALVVAADDGVMPQTVEAINHSKAAGVPIIVVINKIDLPTANPERVKQQLMTYELLPEELGGETLFVEISAKKGIGIDKFVETLLLQAEMLELRADHEGHAVGVVIEALLNTQRGIEATVLVQHGILKVGDVLLAGQTFGRIRAMLDHLGRPVEEAGPSFPARVYGLTGEPPEAGEPFLVLADERKARHIAETRASRRRAVSLSKSPRVSLEGLQEYLRDAEVKELRVVLKADVQGSVEAIEQSFEKILSEKVKIRVLHSAVGAIGESDVRLAAASDAVVIGFNVRPDSVSESLAQQEGVEIKTYNVIYDLLDEIQGAMLGLLETKYREEPQGKAEVLETFKVSKVGVVAGCMVTAGEIQMAANARLVRDGSVVYTGKVSSLRRVKEDVSRVREGIECGVGLVRFGDIKKGDVIETHTLVELERTL